MRLRAVSTLKSVFILPLLPCLSSWELVGMARWARRLHVLKPEVQIANGRDQNFMIECRNLLGRLFPLLPRKH